MRATWLASVLRDAGLTVHEVSGWKTRGSDSWGPVRGITCHHTAGSRTSSDAGEINVLLNGSTSAPPPIAQLYLSRTGAWHVVAAGACNHNKIGWDGPNEGYGNDALLGIEAQHSGGSEPWTPVQYRSYVRGVAALVRHKAPGFDVTAARVAGHKEHQPGAKSDPTFNMDTFRAAVRAELEEWDMSADEVADEIMKRLNLSADGRTANGRTFGGTLDALASTNIAENPIAKLQIPDYGQPAESRRMVSLASWLGWTDHNHRVIVSTILQGVAALERVDTDELVAALAPALVAGVVAALPDGSDPVSQAEVTEAFKAALRDLVAAAPGTPSA